MLSIVIVNWNTRDLLLACLKSIWAFAPKEQFEVIVVDNASSDGSAKAIGEAFSDITLIANRANVGYAAANNQGFAAASGEWILTLNPDTELIDDSLQRAVGKLRDKPGLGGLGAKQVGPDGKVQRSVRGFPSFWGIFGDIVGLAKVFPRSRLGSYRLPCFDYEKEQPAPQPMGTFLLLRREAIVSLLQGERSTHQSPIDHQPSRPISPPPAPSPFAGTKHPENGEGVLKPFDESFPIFFNEVDLLYRMDKAGWPCMYSPDVVIKHYGGESTKQVRKSMIWESHRSLVRFFKKHYRTPWNAAGIWLLSGIIYLAAFVRARGYDAGFRT